MNGIRIIKLGAFLSCVCLLTACPSNSNGFSLSIEGNSYTYRIPAELFARPGQDSLFSSSGSDETASLHRLVIPPHHIDSKSIGSESGVSMLIVLPKGGRDSVSILEGAKRIAREWGATKSFLESENLSAFERSRSGGKDTYYLTFDPTVARKEDLSELDFRAQVTMEKPIAIGELTTTPRAGCSIEFVHDGIFIDAHFSGDDCEAGVFRRWHAEIRGMFKSWRVTSEDEH